jgi:ferredoxin
MRAFSREPSWCLSGRATASSAAGAAATGTDHGQLPADLADPGGLRSQAGSLSAPRPRRVPLGHGGGLDRCIGCGACAAACYAENNIGIVGEKRIVEGREMAWLQIQRYQDPKTCARVTFLPMMCQQCDNAPCESVCPVYAPHHNKEGLNNQIYNRCIGTRFVRRTAPTRSGASTGTLGMAGAARSAAEPRRHRAGQRGDGKVLLLHPAHQGGPQCRQK